MFSQITSSLKKLGLRARDVGAGRPLVTVFGATGKPFLCPRSRSLCTHPTALYPASAPALGPRAPGLVAGSRSHCVCCGACPHYPLSATVPAPSRCTAGAQGGSVALELLESGKYRVRGHTQPRVGARRRSCRQGGGGGAGGHGQPRRGHGGSSGGIRCLRGDRLLDGAREGV